MSLAARARAAVPVLAVIGMTAISAVTFAGFFADDGAWRPLGVGLAIGGLAGLLTGLWKARSVWRVLVVVVLLLVSTVAIALLATGSSPLTLGSAPDLLAGVAQGWSRMLTVGAPARSTADLVALPGFLVTVAALTGVAVALRRPSQLLPILPPFIAYVIALLVTQPVRGSRLIPALAFLMLALMSAFVTADPRSARSSSAGGGAGQGAVATPSGRSWSRSAVGLPVLAVVALAAIGLTLATPLASSAGGFDPRRSRDDAPRTRTTLSPLIGLKSDISRRPASTRFTVTLRSGTMPDRFRVAYLSDYDGVTWSDTDTFQRPPAVIESDAPPSAPTSVLAVSVLDPVSPYVPVAGMPVAVDGADLQRGQNRGNLVEGHSTESALSYILTTRMPLPQNDPRLRKATVGGLLFRPGDTSLPSGLPAAVSAEAVKVTAGKITAWDKADAIRAYILNSFGYSTAVPPGESYATIAQLLTKTFPYTAGFAEQRASAFAVLARSVGLPTRVALGYQVPRASLGKRQVTLSTSDAHAWPEVLFDGWGWVPFEPTDRSAPAVVTKVAPPSDGGRVGGTGPGLGGAPGTVPLLVPREPSVLDRVLAVLRLVAAVILALAVAYVGTVLSVKGRRRRRRRSARETGSAVLGAWSEALDRLVEAGNGQSHSDTPSEVAARVAASLGPSTATAVERISPLVSSALYAAEPPTQHEVATAWSCEAELRVALDEHRSFAGRCRARLDPRPLMGSRKRTARSEVWRRRVAVHTRALVPREGAPSW